MIENGIMEYIKENIKIMFKDITSGDKEKFRKQFANLLTLTRGIFAPIFIIFSLCIHSLEMSFIIILISALTDSFDGWYARKNNYVSEFGRLLDTICDKIFSICIILPVIPIAHNFFIAILSLEILISIVNTYLQVTGKKTKTSLLGKLKTIILDTTLVICYFSLISNISNNIVRICLEITIIFQIIAFMDYLIKLIKQVKIEKIEREKI